MHSLSENVFLLRKMHLLVRTLNSAVYCAGTAISQPTLNFTEGAKEEYLISAGKLADAKVGSYSVLSAPIFVWKYAFFSPSTKLG